MIGDYVETIDGIKGEVIKIKNDIAYIETEDFEVFFCSVYDIKNWNNYSYIY